MSEHKHVIKFDVKTYPCKCGLEFSQELAETLVEAALSGSLPTVQLGIDLEFEKRKVAELEAEVTKCHELQDSYCARIAELEGEIAKMKKYFHKPAHGTCCTCQKCGHTYDECRCDFDEALDDLDKANARIAELEAYIDQLIEAGEKMFTAVIAAAVPYDEGMREWDKIVNDWKEG